MKSFENCLLNEDHMYISQFIFVTEYYLTWLLILCFAYLILLLLKYKSNFIHWAQFTIVCFFLLQQ